MKGKSTRLRNATGVELWQRFQRPLQDLQIWRTLAQRLLDVTASLPDLPSIHTFLPQIEVTVVLPGGLTSVQGGGGRPPARHDMVVGLLGKVPSREGPPGTWVELIAPYLESPKSAQ